MQNTRAQAGGETGKNGEFYKGGQFLPSTTLPKQAPRTQKQATRKQEIAPYTWEVPPAANMRSIYTKVGVGVMSMWSEGKFREQIEITNIKQALIHYKVDREELQTLIDLWNAGERWMEVA